LESDVSGLLPRIERLLEGLVEGGSRRLFRQALQPIELAKAAARTMQAGQVVGPGGIEVPNAFTIQLHPDDFAQFEPARRSFEAQMARYLVTFAEDRGLRPIAHVEVTLVADEHVARRRIEVGARMADPAEPQTRAVLPLEHTTRLPRASRTRGQADAGLLTLALEDGRQIGVRAARTTLGRALDNDIVVADNRVSRYHAEIAADPPDYVVRDLGSTNGTSLAGRPVARDRLCDGDVISLGGYRVEVRLGGVGETDSGTRGASRR
jgi:hypothetical protein